MANTDNPRGLRPVKSYGGGTPMRSGGYNIASAYANDIFKFDPVASAGTGRNIQLGTASGVQLGVFAGWQGTLSDGTPEFRPNWTSGTSASDIVSFVWDDPSTVFSVQSSGTVAAADIGQTTTLSLGSGDATLGTSTTEIAATFTTGKPVKLIGLDDMIPNNATGANADVLVLFHLHENRGALNEV